MTHPGTFGSNTNLGNAKAQAPATPYAAPHRPSPNNKHSDDFESPISEYGK